MIRLAVLWSHIRNLPTTLAGYGITDAASSSDLSTHAADTTDVHGIADTAALLTTSSAAGGDLSGTLSSLQIAAGAVGTSELANDSVTYAKLQNISAPDRLLGRGSPGAGDAEEIACTAAGRALLDDADATAQRATLSAAAAIAADATVSAGSQTWTAMPAALTELLNSSSRRLRLDLTYATEARLIARVATGGATNAELRVQYSTDESAWNYLDGGTGPALTIATTGTRGGAWTSIAPGAKADVVLRIIGVNGDGSASPVLGNVSIQVR